MVVAPGGRPYLPKFRNVVEDIRKKGGKVAAEERLKNTVCHALKIANNNISYCEKLKEKFGLECNTFGRDINWHREFKDEIERIKIKYGIVCD
jgi:hypothetical protein